MTHISHRGAASRLIDTVACQVTVIFDNMPFAKPLIPSNCRLPIVVAAPQRLAQLANGPWFKQVGLEPADSMASYNINGLKRMPKEVVNKSNAAVQKVPKHLDVRRRIEDTWLIVAGNTPLQFSKKIKAQFVMYSNVLITANLKFEWSGLG